MQAGKHRTRITIERPTETAATDGQLVPSWSTYAARWGRVKYTGGGESFADKQSKAVLSAEVRLRSDSATRAITPAMRLKIGSRVLYVKSQLDEDEGRREVVLQCEERVG